MFEQLLASGGDPAELAREVFQRAPAEVQCDLLAGHVNAGSADLECAIRLALSDFVGAARKGEFCCSPVQPGQGWDERFEALMAGHRLLSRIGLHGPAAVGFEQLFALLSDSALEQNLFPDENLSLHFSSRLTGYLRDYLASLLARGKQAIEVVDCAVTLAAYGGLTLLPELLTPDAELICALAERSASDQIEHYRQSLYLQLAEDLLRGRDPGQYRSFLEAHVDRFPRLLDPLVRLARDTEDWAELLALARRGLTLREDRHKYNQIASEAMEAMGQRLS